MEAEPFTEYFSNEEIRNKWIKLAMVLNTINIGTLDIGKVHAILGIREEEVIVLLNLFRQFGLIDYIVVIEADQPQQVSVTIIRKQ